MACIIQYLTLRKDSCKCVLSHSGISLAYKYMISNKYIPVSHKQMFYIYDCMNKWLYPCSKSIYEAFVVNGERLLQDKNICPHNYKGHNELSNFINMLQAANKKFRKQSYLYPEVNRQDVLEKLANTSSMTLEITEACNLHCVYCCYGDLYRNTQKHVKESKESILYYLNTLLELRKKNSVKTGFRISFYGGEPLLRFDIIKECVCLSHSSLPNTDISFGMTTNGLLIDRYMDYLVENDFHLLISLDGNEENNKYRIHKNGKHSFPQVVKNINMLYNKHKDFFNKNVLFSTVLHGKNNCIEAVEYFSRWNKIPIFSQVSPSGVKKNSIKFKEVGRLHAYTEKEIAEFREKHPQVSDTLFPTADGKVCGWGKDSASSMGDFNEIINEEKYLFPWQSCFLFSNKVFVTVDGSLFLCEKSSRKYIFGKVKKTGLAIYLKRINKYYQDINELYNSRCSHCYKSISCESCFFNDDETICSGACFCSRRQAIDSFQQMINAK